MRTSPPACACWPKWGSCVWRRPPSGTWSITCVAPIDPSDGSFRLERDERTRVDRYNEQISLLCNTAGALWLAGAARRVGRPLPNLQPIYRTHAAPPGERQQQLAHLVGRIVRRRGLDPQRWAWHRSAGESLADYLARLPEHGPQSRITLAIHNQALRINERSLYSPAPESHFGVGAEVYARFSAPMREIVGIFTHKEAIELLRGQGGAAVGKDEELRAAVIEAGNRSKGRQSSLTKAVEGLAIDQLLRRDLELAPAERPWRRGTLTGVGRGRAYVHLDDPPIGLKLYLDDLARHTRLPYSTEADGVTVGGPEGRLWRMGDAIELRVVIYSRRRWLLEPSARTASLSPLAVPTQPGENTSG